MDFYEIFQLKHVLSFLGIFVIFRFELFQNIRVKLFAIQVYWSLVIFGVGGMRTFKTVCKPSYVNFNVSLLFFSLPPPRPSRQRQNPRRIRVHIYFQRIYFFTFPTMARTYGSKSEAGPALRGSSGATVQDLANRNYKNG